MTTDYKVTELFCIIDEFCKHFDAENAGNLLEDVCTYLTRTLFLPLEHIVSLITSQRHCKDTASKTPNSCHGFLRSRFIPVFVLKSLAKENGVQFPKCSLSIVSFW
jgi:hypothetical protein